VGPRLHVTSGPGFYTDPDAIVDADGSIILYVGKVTDGSCAQSAGTTTGCVPIRMARSTDGLTFTMYAGNVLTPGAGAAVFADPDVFIDPSGKWHMLYGDTNHGVNLLRIADRQ
jgi:sucrose-6-phosphate hydrolase SacC (GH32 family)